jgi:hypothetical protein
LLSGVNVQNFGDFGQFSAKKVGDFLENHCCDQFWAQNGSKFKSKSPNFFGEKFLKNDNIDPQVERL